MSADWRTLRHRVPLYLSALLLLPHSFRPALALTPTVTVSQYAHTAWRVQDGVFEGTPTAITQTTDGYLWLGTTSGLFRFDGVRFVRFAPQGIPPTSPGEVFSLLSTRDGSLWVGLQGVLLQWRQGNWKRVLPIIGRVNALTESPDGTVWVALTRTEKRTGGFCSVSQPGIQCFGKEMGITSAANISPRQDGSLRVGLSSGVLDWKNGQGIIRKPAGDAPGTNLQSVAGIIEEEDGSSLIGMVTPGPELGIQRLSKAGAWSPYILPGFNGTAVSVMCMRRDRDGNVWIGTLGDGLYRIHDQTVSHYSRADGLSSNGAFDSYEDREGNLWFITATGIDRFRNLPVITYTDAEGLNALRVTAVLAARDGTVWLSNGEGLNFIRDGKMQLLDHSNGLPGNRITSLLEDSRGRLWFGVDGKLAMLDAGKFRLVNRANGSPTGPIKTMAEDSHHDIWLAIVAGKPNTLVKIDASMKLTDVEIPSVSGVSDFAPDPHGGLWIASGSQGIWHYDLGNAEQLKNATISAGQLEVDATGALIVTAPIGFMRWQAGVAHRFGLANGLPCPHIFSTITSQSGSLWLYTECGIVEITKAQLAHWWADPDARLDLRLLSAQDGALPSATAFSPAASESSDGRLWFATSTVLQMVDPRHLESNLLPPPVHIESVIADRKVYAPESGLRLPKLTGDLEIDYTALSLVSPEKVRFKYKLDGFDSDWQDAGTRRQAFYTNLGPRHYVFHVIACNNDGVWNDVGALLPFSIAPAFYQTLWFKLVCALLGLLAFWALFRLRLRQATKAVRERLAGQVAERERIARELHDTFLQGLYAVLLRFHTIADQVDEDAPVRKMMTDALNRADAVLVQGRESLRDLRGEPSTLMTIGEELECFAQECRLDSGAQFDLETLGQPCPLHPVIRDEIIQVGREAILNAFRHSDASSIHVELCYERTFFSLSVSDDGRGIDPKVLAAGGKTGHWGMLGMSERCRKIGAQFTISSPSRRGTQVKLRIPSKLAYASTPSFVTRSKQFFSQKPGAPAKSEASR